MSDVAVKIAGERLLLLPERAALWERASTLLVTDAHRGKAAVAWGDALHFERAVPVRSPALATVLEFN